MYSKQTITWNAHTMYYPTCY